MADSSPPPPPLHIFFFPLMAPGHIIPLTKMAVLFSTRGAKSTVITTPANADLVRRSAGESHLSSIHFLLLQFPSDETGLPQGHESLTVVTTSAVSLRFFRSLDSLRQPFDRLLRDHRPDCVISDMFLPWTADVSVEAGIPRIIFHGMGFFPQCVLHSLGRHMSELKVDGEGRILIPGIPHRIEMKRSQIHDSVFTPNEFGEFMAKVIDSETKSLGAVVNSFYELEPDYVEHYTKKMKRKAWHVGPLCLHNAPPPLPVAEENCHAGHDHACLAWQESKKPNSVIYVCFGSLCKLTAKQLREIELGLEASGHPYLWVVRNDGGEVAEWQAEGVKNGMVVRGWAPQTAILNHPSTGGFLTHCGWNSVVEAVSAGLAMVTWPLEAEQFYNERLVVEVLGVGVESGAEEWGMRAEEKRVVGREEVAGAVRRVMGDGEEAEGRRRRAVELKEKAARAVAEGGSSDIELGRLMEELTAIRRCRQG